MMKRVVVILMAAMLTTAAWAEEEEETRCACPLDTAGFISEGENCGVEHNNDGCSRSPVLFKDIQCGDSICGKIRVKTSSPQFYDDDWYRVVVPGNDSVRVVWKVKAEFGVTIKIIAPGPGNDSCRSKVILVTASRVACSTAVVSKCVSPGTYWLEVKPTSTSSSITCDNGDYIAWVTCSPCHLSCPPGAQLESENCGDHDNDGCSLTPREFEVITCPSTICGKAKVIAVYDRCDFCDDDWFQVTLTGNDSLLLVWRVRAEFRATIKIIRPGTGASPSCTGRVTLDSATVSAWGSAEVSKCVWPGTYWLEVKPFSCFDEFSCADGDYIAEVSCLPCHPEPPFTEVDMGDLDSCQYPTLVNNPAHGLSNIAWLGDSVTGEPTPYANNSDLRDDGVDFLNAPWWQPCHMESLTVRVTGGVHYVRYANAGGLLFLNAWKDGNLDGDFCDEIPCLGAVAPEWFLQNVIVVPRPQVYGFRVLDPGVESTRPYDGVFRFRLTSRRMVDAFGFGSIDLSYCPNMTCGSFGIDFLGEVEDYVMTDFQLALEMGTFDAIPGDNRVTLRWNTRSESNNDYFDIERDGAVVARPRSLGDSPSGHTYQWVDEQVQSSVTYTYKLYSVDLNGTRRALATASAAPNSPPAAVTEYALNQNYPNPFNPTTQITFDLVESGLVTLTIFNPMGQTVTTLVNGTLTAGRHTVAFDASNLPTGVYLYRLEAGSFTAARKMLLIK